MDALSDGEGALSLSEGLDVLSSGRATPIDCDVSSGRATPVVAGDDLDGLSSGRGTPIAFPESPILQPQASPADLEPDAEPP